MLNVRFKNLVVVAGVLSGLLGASCNGNPAKQYIDKATFKLSDDLKSARVALVFTDKVKAAFETDFAIKDYGSVFTLPFVDGKQSFSAGFDLNMNVVYDNGYVQLEPTSYLPNGLPLGLPNPVVAVPAGSVAGGAAQFLAYVDIKGLSWLGMATMIEAVDQNFPSGLSISQVFRRNSEGVPEVFGSFFGPTLNSDGSVAKAGGLAIFANVKSLIAAAKEQGSDTIELRPEAKLELSGPAAAYYRAHPAELSKVGHAYVEALSSLR